MNKPIIIAQETFEDFRGFFLFRLMQVLQQTSVSSKVGFMSPRFN